MRKFQVNVTFELAFVHYEPFTAEDIKEMFENAITSDVKEGYLHVKNITIKEE